MNVKRPAKARRERLRDRRPSERSQPAIDPDAAERGPAWRLRRSAIAIDPESC
jgi:hypothetical protein